MHVTSLSKKDLLAPLSYASQASETRSLLPVLQNVRITIKDKLLSVCGSDSEVESHAHYDIENADSSEGVITVSGRKISSIVKSLSDNTPISFEIADAKFVIRAGSGKYTLTTLSADLFPELPQDKPIAVLSVQAAKFLQLMDHVSGSTASGEKVQKNPVIGGVEFKLGLKALRLAATDGFRLAKAYMPPEDYNISQLEDQGLVTVIPNKCLALLKSAISSNPSEQLHIQITENGLIFHIGSASLTSRSIAGKFPDLERATPKSVSTPLVINPKDILDAVRAATICADDSKTAYVILNLKNNILTTSSYSKGTDDESCIETDCAYDGDEITIGFQSVLLTDVISTLLSNDNIELHIKDPNTGIKVHGVGKPELMHVVMPFRL